MKKINLINQKFGLLTVTKEAQRTNGKRPMWVCECECGGQTEATTNSLRSGNTKSCGCRKLNSRTTHNGCYTRLYKTYSNMKSRCYNNKVVNYKYYGGKGIRVCSSWLSGFENFRDWAEDNGYSDDLTIDRIDNNGNYEPSNCRFATMKIQANNRVQSGKTSGMKHLCKVSLDEASEICEAYATGLFTAIEISMFTGVSRSTISHITNGRIKNFN